MLRVLAIAGIVLVGPAFMPAYAKLSVPQPSLSSVDAPSPTRAAFLDRA